MRRPRRVTTVIRGEGAAAPFEGGTRVRATAQGLAYNAGRMLAAAGALQMGALMHPFDGSYARAGAIITLVYVIGLDLIWFAPETKGQSLPE